MNTKEEFFQKVIKSEEPEGCWKWDGGREGGGYGSLLWNGKRTQAHRVAYLIEYNEIPEGSRIRWSCKNKICVRPSHLSVGKKRVKEDAARPALKEVKPKLRRVPTILLDKDQPRIMALIQELTQEADKVDKDRMRALVKCYESKSLIDIVIIKLQEVRDIASHMSKKALEIFSDNELSRFAEEGRKIVESGGIED